MSDWLAGFGGNQGGYTPRPRPLGQREPERPPVPPPPKGCGGVVSNRQWTPGQARASAEVACCPKCGALRVKIRTPLGDTTVLMECRDCRHRWKDQRCDRIA